MKLVLVALGLLVSLATVGIACGPKEKYCYEEGLTCEMVKAQRAQDERQTDASDAADACPIKFDPVTGARIPCDAM